MKTNPIVLVVDDSKVSRSVVGGHIKTRLPDAEVIEAADGPSALAAAHAHRPDLVVLDINMPGISGLDVAQQLKAQHPDTLIALLTANMQVTVQMKAAALGAAIYHKPARGDVIDQILQLLETP
ncbi:MAG: response regulator [Burkholderiaceae bacterium]|nr:response regulator [Roseateles sp.]MBV8469933.1 response regulator [Burkholderiaceae bacterium]